MGREIKIPLIIMIVSLTLFILEFFTLKTGEILFEIIPFCTHNNQTSFPCYGSVDAILLLLFASAAISSFIILQIRLLRKRFIKKGN